MGKKVAPNSGRQVNFRASEDLYARLERVANVLGVDLSNLVRQVLHEYLPEFELRADRIEAKRQRPEETPDSE